MTTPRTPVSLNEYRASRRVRAGAPAPDFAAAAIPARLRFETHDEWQERVISDFERVGPLPFQRTVGSAIWIGYPLAVVVLLVYAITR